VTAAAGSHAGEQHDSGVSGLLNALRAGVLGANDGIVSIAGLVVGVAGAGAGRPALLTAGVAGLVAGALSMAGGEYVSVSTQRDTERALLRKEQWELEHLPEDELAELAGMYEDRGISPDLARQVAEQLTAHGALQAHAEIELGIDLDALTSPWQAARASLAAFMVGGLLPLLAILLPPNSVRVPSCFAAVVLALVLTGWLSATWGRAPVRPAVVRNVAVGGLAMLVTFAIGALLGPVVG
jgi:VIT1/CCC1 family predicted Fe2+/Mn2+ transporter